MTELTKPTKLSKLTKRLSAFHVNLPGRHHGQKSSQIERQDDV